MNGEENERMRRKERGSGDEVVPPFTPVNILSSSHLNP
jgi:hypothetical protein